ncbi:MAG: YiiX/YebB-like N1pC/P60 family cysteine hydrolase, partial [Balneolaceae bacterium]
LKGAVADYIRTDVDDLETRISLYKVMFGMRATTEEVLLQSKEEIEPVIYVTDESSATPSTELFGIKVHSGDLLVSRGGAEVSALISRGNDFPDNFSHVALIYVEEGTNTAYLIEAHIERGVAIASAEEYMNDGKQRFMVLRPRADLPELIAEPMLPHLAAKDVFNEVNTRHIPYDFKMDFYDSEKMFCSEVGSYAYKNRGIKLWESESTISSNGVVTLLNTFGVENFVTQMPSDLEYDPKLSVVAEWRDTEALYEDHLYNAVIDAMLECAELEVEIDVNHFMLPAVRLVKGYSVIQNWMDSEGPVPEGMNATQALKSDAFIQRHEYLKMITDEDIQEFNANENYLPPYWEMFRIARENARCVEIN